MNKPSITLNEWMCARKKRHKFNAVRCESKDGVKFPSKLERQYYDRLVEAQGKGRIEYFLSQVPFRLPGNVKYLVDFMVVYMEDSPMKTIEYIDVKGKMTAMSTLKIKQVEALYPVKIKIVDSTYMKTNQL